MTERQSKRRHISSDSNPEDLLTTGTTKPLLACGVDSWSGRREYQEDRFASHRIDAMDLDFFAIYDGHGSDKISEQLSQELHHRLTHCFHQTIAGRALQKVLATDAANIADLTSQRNEMRAMVTALQAAEGDSQGPLFLSYNHENS
eukprot:m.108704 g.108704  ORF g.108704 m.108704 type:complete len:146 (-) comp22644_c0_seq3:103-540(-)